MFKSLKNLLGLSLLAFFGVWMGCSSDSSPASPSNKAVTGDDGSATQVSTVTVSTEITIPDVRLDYAVREKLGDRAPRVTTASLTTAHMLHLRVLKAADRDIANLEGLQHATNLDTLILHGNDIESLAPLAGLTGLEHLDLGGNKITDVTPLAGLRDLEYLHLKLNNIANLTPLAGLTKLTSLDLDNNLIPQTGYSPLANLTKLTNLVIAGHRNVNIGSAGLAAVVAEMHDLKRLKVNSMGLTDISFLEDLPKLSIVVLSSNKGITDFKPLTCLPNLSILRVHNIPAVYTLPAGHDRYTQVATGHDPFIQYLLEDDRDITVSVVPYAGGQ